MTNLALLVNGPTLYMRCQRHGTCFVSPTNPLLLFVYNQLTPSLALENFWNQKQFFQRQNISPVSVHCNTFLGALHPCGALYISAHTQNCQTEFYEIVHWRILQNMHQEFQSSFLSGSFNNHFM